MFGIEEELGGRCAFKWTPWDIPPEDAYYGALLLEAYNQLRNALETDWDWVVSHLVSLSLNSQSPLLGGDEKGVSFHEGSIPWVQWFSMPVSEFEKRPFDECYCDLSEEQGLINWPVGGVLRLKRASVEEHDPVARLLKEVIGPAASSKVVDVENNSSMDAIGLVRMLPYLRVRTFQHMELADFFQTQRRHYCLFSARTMDARVLTKLILSSATIHWCLKPFTDPSFVSIRTIHIENQSYGTEIGMEALALLATPKSFPALSELRLTSFTFAGAGLCDLLSVHKSRITSLQLMKCYLEGAFFADELQYPKLPKLQTLEVLSFDTVSDNSWVSRLVSCWECWAASAPRLESVLLKFDGAPSAVLSRMVKAVRHVFHLEISLSQAEEGLEPAFVTCRDLVTERFPLHERALVRFDPAHLVRLKFTDSELDQPLHCPSLRVLEAVQAATFSDIIVLYKTLQTCVNSIRCLHVEVALGNDKGPLWSSLFASMPCLDTLIVAADFEESISVFADPERCKCRFHFFSLRGVVYSDDWVVPFLRLHSDTLRHLIFERSYLSEDCLLLSNCPPSAQREACELFNKLDEFVLVKSYRFIDTRFFAWLSTSFSLPFDTEQTLPKLHVKSISLMANSPWSWDVFLNRLQLRGAPCDIRFVDVCWSDELHVHLKKVYSSWSARMHHTLPPRVRGVLRTLMMCRLRPGNPWFLLPRDLMFLLFDHIVRAT